MKPQPATSTSRLGDETSSAHIRHRPGIGREMDSDQSDDEARAFAVPDGLPDFTIESFEDVTAEEFLRRVAYVFLFVV